MGEDEAYEAWKHATWQIEQWDRHPESAFAKAQIEMWRTIQSASAWWQPGSPGLRTYLNDSERAEMEAREAEGERELLKGEQPPGDSPDEQPGCGAAGGGGY